MVKEEYASSVTVIGVTFYPQSIHCNSLYQCKKLRKVVGGRCVVVAFQEKLEERRATAPDVRYSFTRSTA